MATYKTSFAADQDNRAITRTANPSARDVQQVIKRAVFSFTLTGALVAADIIKLGALEVDGAVILPEGCRLTDTATGGGTLTATFRLQSVTNGATAVAESADLAFVSGSALSSPFARLASGLNTSLKASNSDQSSAGFPSTTPSYLQLLVVTNGSFSGGAALDVLTIEIAYRSPKSF